MHLLEEFIRTNDKHALAIDDNTFNYFKGTSCWVNIYIKTILFI